MSAFSGGNERDHHCCRSVWNLNGWMGFQSFRSSHDLRINSDGNHCQVKLVIPTSPPPTTVFMYAYVWHHLHVLHNFIDSCLCKPVERMINGRLVWYLEKNKLITNNMQSGFCKSHKFWQSLGKSGGGSSTSAARGLVSKHENLGFDLRFSEFH